MERLFVVTLGKERVVLDHVAQLGGRAHNHGYGRKANGRQSAW